MSIEDEVRQVSDRFYAALNRALNGDAEPMMEVWWHNSDVTTMHPMGSREVGWEQVRAHWEQVAELSSGGQAAIRSPLVRVVGDLAYEIGTESGELTFAGHPVFFGYRVTNIYRREVGVWKMVHHHTDIDVSMVEILRRSQSSSG
ncbi:MAG: nuclear transport factor 2 family protein [Chloroflexi bacterium]|nr:nuclear transport factor 2 family protein [Chloroflexota bacterium]